MDTTMQHLGERWLAIYAIINHLPFTYDNGVLNAQAEIFFTKEELNSEISKLEAISSLTETDQSVINALECLKLVKEKIGG